LLGLEVRVEGPLGEARILGHLVDGGALEPAPAEDLGGGPHEARARPGLVLLPGEPSHQAAASAAAGAGRVTPASGRAMTSAPRLGVIVIARRVTRSGTGSAGSSRTLETIADRTACISNSAKLAPRQRRTPPPNGIQVYVPAGRSRKRSGRN